MPPSSSDPVRGRLRTLSVLLFLFLLSSLAAARPGLAQDVGELRREISESQSRLEQIREERAELQREMESLRTRVRSVSGELENIERQLSTSRSVLSEIDFQVEATAEQVDATTSELLKSREELRERQAILNRRLRDIYKRGPLHTTRVLLGAESFADLLNRYHYLQLIASYDRILIGNVREMEEELVRQTRELQESLSELGRLRDTKVSEVAELRQVEEEHQRTLAQFRADENRAETRMEQLDQDEGRLTDLISDLERRRIEEERRRMVAGAPAEGAATLSTRDVGTLDWPVDGDILYPFGIERRPNGTVLRWNGVGIQATPGTPVRAVRAGTVVLAGPFEGYGPSVILSHGQGYYTLYLYLEDVGVVEGRTVTRGQVVGTVGGSGTPEGPRLEFQVRAPMDGAPQAVDPLRWLSPRGESE